MPKILLRLPSSVRLLILAGLLLGCGAFALLGAPRAYAASIPAGGSGAPLPCLTLLYNRYTSSNDEWNNQATGSFDIRNDCGTTVSYGTITIWTTLHPYAGTPCSLATSKDIRGFGLAPGHTLAGDLGKPLTYSAYGNCLGCDCHGLPTEWFWFEMWSFPNARARAIINGQPTTVILNWVPERDIAHANFTNSFGETAECWGSASVQFTY